MKKKNLIARLLLAGVVFVGSTMTLASCNNDDDDDDDDTSTTTTNTIEFEGETYTVVSGDITSNMELTAGTKYLLSGGVFVKDGVTLTIPAGMTVYADSRGTSFLSIERGGKIMAEGEANSPIVFTSLNTVTGQAKRGDWGGIVINGKAVNNAGTDVQGEGGSGAYGGTEDGDNSGVIKYLRVEYAGSILGTDNEMNTFSFNSVGSATQISYIQAWMGQDDGIEFFGGTVDLTYAVSSGSRDDSFDWTQGWRGNGTNWIVEQASDEGDRGIEADNNGDDNNATPFANPTIDKLTIYSRGENDGVILREGTKATISNALIDGAKDGIEIDGDVSVQHFIDGDIVLTNITMQNLADSDSLYIDASDATVQTNGENAADAWSNGDGTGADSFTSGSWYKALPADVQL